MKQLTTIVAVLIAVGLGSNSYGALSVTLLEENFDSVGPETPLTDLGWSIVYQNTSAPRTLDVLIDDQNSAGVGNSFSAIVKKALPGGAYTLNAAFPEHFFRLSAVIDINLDSGGHTAQLNAFNSTIDESGCRGDTPACLSGIYLNVASNGGPGTQEIQLNGTGLFGQEKASISDLTVDDFPVHVALEIHAAETFLHYTTSGGSTVTLAPAVQAGMSTVEEVRLFWQLFAETDSVLLEAVIPEPTSLALLSLGGLLMMKRRRKA